MVDEAVKVETVMVKVEAVNPKTVVVVEVIGVVTAVQTPPLSVVIPVVLPVVTAVQAGSMLYMPNNRRNCIRCNQCRNIPHRHVCISGYRIRCPRGSIVVHSTNSFPRGFGPEVLGAWEAEEAVEVGA